MKKNKKLNISISELIEIAWCDKTSFDDIRRQIGLNESQVKKIMKSNLKPRSYKVWRERVRWIKEKHKNNRISLFKE